MGKQGSQKQWAGKWASQPEWGSASSWDAWGSSSGGYAGQQYWEATGSWDTAQGAQQPPNKGKGKEHLFPKYSDVKVQESSRVGGSGQDLQLSVWFEHE